MIGTPQEIGFYCYNGRKYTLQMSASIFPVSWEGNEIIPAVEGKIPVIVYLRVESGPSVAGDCSIYSGGTTFRLATGVKGATYPMTQFPWFIGESGQPFKGNGSDPASSAYEVRWIYING